MKRKAKALPKKSRTTPSPIRITKSKPLTSPPKRGNAKRNVTVTRRTLLPVMRPTQNLRDIIKQMLLLEDHLFQPQKRCPDCIRKHFLTIEGLAEECATLCKPTNILPESRSVAKNMRVLHHVWEQDPGNPHVNEHIASRIRKHRKGLMKQYSTIPLHKLPSCETDDVMKILKHIKAGNKT